MLAESSVRIGAITYDLWYDADACTASGVRGQALLDEAKILLDPRLPRRLMLTTLLHEAFHAAFETSTLTAGKAVKGAEPEVDEALEERLCTFLESVIPRMVHDNPWMFEDWTHD